MSYELRVESLKARVEIQKCEFKSTSYEFESTSYEFESTSYGFESTTYEFKSTRAIKSIKTQVNSLKRSSFPKMRQLVRSISGDNFLFFLFYVSITPWLRVLFLLQKKFPLYLFNKSNITISRTENHTELSYLLKANGNTKCYVTLYAEFCFHHIGQFLQSCKNLWDIMETWYKQCYSNINYVTV